MCCRMVHRMLRHTGSNRCGGGFRRQRPQQIQLVSNSGSLLTQLAVQFQLISTQLTHVTQDNNSPTPPLISWSVFNAAAQEAGFAL